MKSKRLLLLLLLNCSWIIACENGNMPQFDLLLVDKKTVLNTGEIPVGNPIVLMFFRTDCSYCQQETKGILERMDELEDTHFYFITVEDAEIAKQYSDKYQLNGYNNIIVGKDTADAFSKHFEVEGTPTIALYDKYKRLRSVVKGTIEVDTLINLIRNL